MIERRRRARRSWMAMPILFGALAVGCTGTRVMSGGPYTSAAQTPEGTLRYSLPKSVVTVEATVTKGASGKVTFDGNEFSVDTRLVRKDAQAVVSIGNVVDENQFFTLKIEHGSSSDDSLTVDIAPNGLLRSLGVISTSQALTTAKNVVTAAASLVALVTAATLGPDPKRQAAALICEKLASEAGTPGRCPVAITPSSAAPPPVRPLVGPTKGESKGDSRNPPPVLPQPQPRPQPSAPPSSAAAGCDRSTETSLGELSMANLFFLARSQKHRRLWLDRRDAEARLQERICRRLELERTAERASIRDLEDVRNKLLMQLELEAAARADLRTAAEDLDRALHDFQLATGIDGPARTEVVRMTFELDDIPPPDVLRKALSPERASTVAGMSEQEVRSVLVPYSRMLELYDRTGIALTITPPPISVRGTTTWSPTTADEPKTRIYYRPSYTVALTTYAMQRTADDQGGEQDLLRFFAVASDDVMHPRMPVMGFSFEPSYFTERQLSLAFDDRGRLVRYEQSGKSSIVGASQAAVEAVQTVRDEYGATLGKIAEIQDTKRRLEQNDVLSEIDRLNKQRELVDARLELAGSRSNYDLVIEKKRLDVQLALVQSRRTLSDDKGSRAVTEEVAQLHQKLDQLTRQVDELQHRTTQTPPSTGPRSAP
jgi:hypothetical protein